MTCVIPVLLRAKPVQSILTLYQGDIMRKSLRMAAATIGALVLGSSIALAQTAPPSGTDPGKTPASGHTTAKKKSRKAGSKTGSKKSAKKRPAKKPATTPPPK
jgi:hypothetical protein